MNFRKPIITAAATALLLLPACGPDGRVPGPAAVPAPLPGAVTPAADDRDDPELHLSATTLTVGSSITLHGEDFAGDAELDIGFGPAGGDYERIGSAITDRDGDFSVTLAPPASAVPGRRYVFVVFGIAGTDVVSEPLLLRTR